MRRMHRGWRRSARTTWSSRETPLIREILLDHVSQRPRLATRLFEELRADFGAIHERRMWRALDWLIRAGLVRVVGRLHQQARYVRSPAPRRIDFAAPLRGLAKKSTLLA